MSMFEVSPMPSLYQKRNSTISLAHTLKKETETPVIAVGGILKPEEADKMMQDGKHLSRNTLKSSEGMSIPIVILAH